MRYEIAQFKKVSKEVFIDELVKSGKFDKITAEYAYRQLALPERATSGSAGYDFHCPFDITLRPGESCVVPTGIRCKMEDGWVLQIFPRSGLGFKYRLQLDNTVGIIDSDYYYSDNEGQIFIKLTNDSRCGQSVDLAAGDRFAQGIFIPHGYVIDGDLNPIGTRNGGMGSTN